MKSPLALALATAAMLPLVACHSKTADDAANNMAAANAAAAVAAAPLPPAIKADKTFRCKDNSLVYVTFFEGDKQASIRNVPTGDGTTVMAPAAGEPMVADGGWKLTGTTSLITVTQPGKPAQTCKG